MLRQRMLFSQIGAQHFGRRGQPRHLVNVFGLAILERLALGRAMQETVAPLQETSLVEALDNLDRRQIVVAVKDRVQEPREPERPQAERVERHGLADPPQDEFARTCWELCKNLILRVSVYQVLQDDDGN